MSKDSEYYMARALEISQKAKGYTSPNPMVGCVIVKGGKIIGEGYHKCYGQLHAERNALKNCKEDPREATLYVTLEPCCHYGKTPPCTDAIIEHGIKKVVIGAMDPNPKVAGKGVSILREHGIEIQTGVLEKECLEANEIFFHYILTKKPFVAMKYAMTLDGKIATFTGSSKWITSEKAREHVHQLRHQYQGIIIGVGTVLKDDPMLNCRIEGGLNPIRIICDSALQTPLNSNIVKSAHEISTIIAYCKANSVKEKELKLAGIDLLKLEKNRRGLGINLSDLLIKLGEKNIDSVLIEGGGTLHGSALEEGIVNKVYAYIAPKLVGGSGALSPVEGRGVEHMKDAVELVDTKYFSLGKDFVIEGKIEKRG